MGFSLLLLSLLLSSEEQSPNFSPKSLTQGIFRFGRFGMLISSAGGLGRFPPGGGPGIKPQRAMGGPPPGGKMMGMSVGVDDPGFVVVTHWLNKKAPLTRVSAEAPGGSAVSVEVTFGV